MHAKSDCFKLQVPLVQIWHAGLGSIGTADFCHLKHRQQPKGMRSPRRELNFQTEKSAFPYLQIARDESWELDTNCKRLPLDAKCAMVQDSIIQVYDSHHQALSRGRDLLCNYHS
jgi:hypothetical protein